MCNSVNRKRLYYAVISSDIIFPPYLGKNILAMAWIWTIMSFGIPIYPVILQTNQVTSITDYDPIADKHHLCFGLTGRMFNNTMNGNVIEFTSTLTVSKLIINSNTINFGYVPEVDRDEKGSFYIIKNTGSGYTFNSNSLSKRSPLSTTINNLPVGEEIVLYLTILGNIKCIVDKDKDNFSLFSEYVAFVFTLFGLQSIVMKTIFRSELERRAEKDEQCLNEYKNKRNKELCNGESMESKLEGNINFSNRSEIKERHVISPPLVVKTHQYHNTDQYHNTKPFNVVEQNHQINKQPLGRIKFASK